MQGQSRLDAPPAPRSTESLVEVAMTEAAIADLLALIDATITLRRRAGSSPVNGR
jgi:hypothetical protein